MENRLRCLRAAGRPAPLEMVTEARPAGMGRNGARA